MVKMGQPIDGARILSSDHHETIFGYEELDLA